jgi:hypothetical protein
MPVTGQRVGPSGAILVADSGPRSLQVKVVRPPLRSGRSTLTCSFAEGGSAPIEEGRPPLRWLRVGRPVGPKLVELILADLCWGRMNFPGGATNGSHSHWSVGRLLRAIRSIQDPTRRRPPPESGHPRHLKLLEHAEGSESVSPPFLRALVDRGSSHEPLNGKASAWLPPASAKLLAALDCFYEALQRIEDLSLRHRYGIRPERAGVEF